MLPFSQNSSAEQEIPCQKSPPQPCYEVERMLKQLPEAQRLRPPKMLRVHLDGQSARQSAHIRSLPDQKPAFPVSACKRGKNLGWVWSSNTP